MSGLMLTRRPGERLLIGDDIVVEVVSVRGQHVGIKVTAPRAVRVDREELRQRMTAGEADKTNSEVTP